MNILQLITLFILVTSVANVLRMMIYLIGGDIYAIKHDRRTKRERKMRAYVPSVSLVVPAHNEAAVIEATLQKLVLIDYPANKLQIIVADDGSTDDTKKIVKKFMRMQDKDKKITFYTQENGGKADVLNNAIRSVATGSLVMCLDADSLIAPDAVRKAAAYFRDRRIVALASNVNIMSNGTILGLAQRFEYLISYHMKKAQTVYNIEYIIGGIGSMFRRSMLNKVNLYDTNTMTEDIDLTMKIIARGNKSSRVAYAADALTYTEAVPTFKSLINQRYRWKYGRMQTFLKNSNLFFSRSKDHTRLLTWYILPYALLQEALFILEPIIVSYILIVSIYYQNPQTILIALSVITFYISVNIWSTAHLSTGEKIKLTLLAPSMYVLLYLLSIVEYVALIRSIAGLKNLRKSISGQKTTWISPERSGAATKVGA